MSEKSGYAGNKAFLEFFARRFFGSQDPEEVPRVIIRLEEIERISHKLAEKGLKEALQDSIVMSGHLDPKAVHDCDSELYDAGLPTLSEMRRRYSRSYKAIIRRQKIKDETEFYLLSGILDSAAGLSEEERRIVERLLSDFQGV